MKPNQRIALIIIGCFAVVAIIGIILTKQRNKRILSDAVVVTGKITRIQFTRSAPEVFVQYYINNKTIDNSFDSYEAYHLKVGTLVNLKVSPSHPDSYIELIRVDTTQRR